MVTYFHIPPTHRAQDLSMAVPPSLAEDDWNHEDEFHETQLQLLDERDEAEQRAQQVEQREHQAHSELSRRSNESSRSSGELTMRSSEYSRRSSERK